MSAIIILWFLVLLHAQPSGSSLDINCGLKIVKPPMQTPASQGTHIVNGNKTHMYAWPWMVLVQAELPNATVVRCGGSLVAVCRLNARSDIVLTAAHCVTTYDNKTKITDIVNETKIQVFVGLHNQYKIQKINLVKVKKVVVYPGYTGEYDYFNDLAVLKLKTHVMPKDPAIYPICLPKWVPGRTPERPNNKTCYIAGWGNWVHPALNRTNSSDVLREAKYKALTIQECLNLLQAAGMSPMHSMEYLIGKVCGVPSDGIQHPREGDSGGPLMCKHNIGQDPIWILYGVMRGSEGLTATGLHVVDDSISTTFYDKFITGTIQNESALCAKCLPWKNCTWYEFE